MNDTKFKFNDKVKVVEGFYRGIEGKVIQYYTYTHKPFFGKETIFIKYTLVSKSFGNHDDYIDRHGVTNKGGPVSKEFHEDCLELIK